MNVKHIEHISIFDDALTKKECDKIIEIYELKSQIEPEISGGKYGSDEMNPMVRKDGSHHTFDLPGVRDLVNNKVEECYKIYKEHFFQVESVNISFNEVKLQKTPIRGGFHDWHCESGDIATIDRCIVWMVYLNDFPEGEGQTEFLWQGIKVQPKSGRLLIWPAFFTHVHRGNPVYSHPKYIATGWGIYTDPDFDKIYFKDETGYYHRILDGQRDLG